VGVGRVDHTGETFTDHVTKPLLTKSGGDGGIGVVFTVIGSSCTFAVWAFVGSASLASR